MARTEHMPGPGLKSGGVRGCADVGHIARNITDDSVKKFTKILKRATATSSYDESETSWIQTTKSPKYK